MTAATQSTTELFESVFAAYYGRVRSFLASQTGDWHLSEDLAEETFAQLWRDMRRGLELENVNRLGGFLTMRARWELNSYRWGGRRERERPAGDWSWLRTGASVPEQTGQVDAHVDMGRLLAMLPATQRRAVALRFLEGLPSEEVAAQIGVSKATANGRLREGLAALRSAAGASATVTPIQQAAARREQAAQVYRASVQARRPITIAALARRFGMSDSWAREIVQNAGGRVPIETIRDRVAAALRADLRAGAFAAGSRVGMALVADRYQATLSTASEALHALCAEGLLERRGQAGTSKARYHVPQRAPLASVNRPASVSVLGQVA